MAMMSCILESATIFVTYKMMLSPVLYLFGANRLIGLAGAQVRGHIML